VAAQPTRPNKRPSRPHASASLCVCVCVCGDNNNQAEGVTNTNTKTKRQHNSPAVALELDEVGEERDGLDGFAQAHLVRQDAVEVVVVQTHQPCQALHLVLLQRAAHQDGRLADVGFLALRRSEQSSGKGAVIEWDADMTGVNGRPTL
jgi:hypothetical protein